MRLSGRFRVILPMGQAHRGGKSVEWLTVVAPPGQGATEAVLNLNDTQDNTNTRFADKVHSSFNQPRIGQRALPFTL